MTSEERTHAISKVISEVAGSYCKRVWWADKLDLMQEAWAVTLASLQRKAVPDEWLTGTVYKIASRRIAQYLWEQSAPVTGTRGSRKRLGGLFRVGAGVDSSPDAEQEYRPELELLAPPSAEPDFPSSQAEAGQGIDAAREELYWRIVDLYRELLVPAYNDDFDPKPVRAARPVKRFLFEAVLRVLVDGGSSIEAAAELGVPLRSVYEETAIVKRLIVADGTAQELLEEISEWRELVAE